MEIKILSVTETKGKIIVEVEHQYGKQTIGLGLHTKYLGDDGVPLWKTEVMEKIQKKYGNRNKDQSIKKKEIFKDEVGKTFKI